MYSFEFTFITCYNILVTDIWTVKQSKTQKKAFIHMKIIVLGELFFFFSISTEFPSSVCFDRLWLSRTCLFVFLSSLDEWRFFQAPFDRGEGSRNKYDELDPKRNHQVLCPKPSFILSRTRHVLWQSFQEKLFL